MFSTTPYISRLSLTMARLVALLAAVLSAYMVYVSFRYFGVTANWGSAPCVDAALSKWGYLLKVPIAVPGLLTYLAIFVITARMKPWDENLAGRRSWPWLIALSTLAAASGLWLMGAQVALLRYICPVCVIVNLCGVLLFFIFVFFMRTRLWTLFFSAAFSGLVLLAQLKVGPPSPRQATSENPTEAIAAAEETKDGKETFKTREGPPNTDLTHAIYDGIPSDGLLDWQKGPAPKPAEYVPIVVAMDNNKVSGKTNHAAAVNSPPRSLDEVLADQEALDALTEKKRTHITMGGGEVYLDLAEVPIIGNPEAPYLIAVMYDYSMPSCLLMLRLLHKEVARYNGDLALILLPTPLDHDCNDAMRFTPRGLVNSCDYARASMEVWITNPRQHIEFETYISRNRDPAPIHTIEWMRERLVSASDMEQRDIDTLASRYISRNCGIWKNLGLGALPKLIFMDKVTAGSPQNPDDMSQFLLQELGAGPSK